ncbi:succinylglutamate desuccinylase/aspartoacylase family protein, partial [Klebsiella michiganensis]
MDDFLALTLAGRLPHHFHGQTAHFRWHWIDCGILQLIPHEPCDRSLVLSSGLHGNETAPVEITDLLLRQLFRGEIPLRWWRSPASRLRWWASSPGLRSP